MSQSNPFKWRHCSAVNPIQETRGNSSTRQTGRAAIIKFQLFDSVKLREAIALTNGGTAPEGTPGAIVEVFNDGEVYMVELFDLLNW